MKIAVVGAGISGLLAARQLCRDHDVYVFEGGSCAGGHVSTADVRIDGANYSVDTGFLLFSASRYRKLAALLAELNTPLQDVDTSFSIRSADRQLEFEGDSLKGLFDHRVNLLFPSSYEMLHDFHRFRRHARRLAAGEYGDVSVGAFLGQQRYSKSFVTRYLFPVASAVWPCSFEQLERSPARTLAAYFDNYGLLAKNSCDGCKSIVGGGRAYIERLVEPIRERIIVNCPVASVHRNPNYVILKFADRPKMRFDHVILATPADLALRLLADATRAERQVLGAFAYESQKSVLHTDDSVLPRRRRAALNWTYSLDRSVGADVSVTFDLSQLLQLAAPQELLLTLHNNRRVDPRRVLSCQWYRRPVFSMKTVAAQRRFWEINGPWRTYYCGAYWGNGFHEDAIESSLAVVDAVQSSPPAHDGARTGSTSALTTVSP